LNLGSTPHLHLNLPHGRTPLAYLSASCFHFSYQLQDHMSEPLGLCASKGAVMISQLWKASMRVARLTVTAIIVVLAFVHPTRAATFTCGDVECLIAAIDTANTNSEDDTINLATGTYTLMIVNNSDPNLGFNGLPGITSNISIIGAGTDATVIERDESAPLFRLFFIRAGTLILKELTIKGGASQYFGGGIRNSVLASDVQWRSYG
jgi:hypothetical protein